MKFQEVREILVAARLTKARVLVGLRIRESRGGEADLAVASVINAVEALEESEAVYENGY